MHWVLQEPAPRSRTEVEDEAFLDALAVATPLPADETTSHDEELQDGSVPDKELDRSLPALDTSFAFPQEAPKDNPTTPPEDPREFLTKLTGLQPWQLEAFPDELPPLPASRPSSPLLQSPETKRDMLSERGTSPTAVPIRFRAPPTSPNARRNDLTLDLKNASSPGSSPLRPTGHRHAKSHSGEFVHSREYRPLYLVERNRKPTEAEQEVLPALPSSGSPSRTSSATETEDEYQSAYESAHGSPSASVSDAFEDALADSFSFVPPGYVEPGSEWQHPELAEREVQDETESEQTTPKASTFPAGVLDVKSNDRVLPTEDLFARLEQLQGEEPNGLGLTMDEERPALLPAFSSHLSDQFPGQDFTQFAMPFMPNATVHAAPTTSGPVYEEHEDSGSSEREPTVPMRALSSSVFDQFPGQDFTRFAMPFVPNATVHATPSIPGPQHDEHERSAVPEREPTVPTRALSSSVFDQFPGQDFTRFAMPFVPHAVVHAAPKTSESKQHSQPRDLDLAENRSIVPTRTLSSSVFDQFPGQDFTKFAMPFTPHAIVHAAPRTSEPEQHSPKVRPNAPMRIFSSSVFDQFPGQDFSKVAMPFMPHAIVHAAPTTPKSEQHSQPRNLDLYEEEPAVPRKIFSSRVTDQFPGQDFTTFATPFVAHATVHAAPTTSKPEEIRYDQLRDLDLYEEEPTIPKRTFSSRVSDQFPGQDFSKVAMPFMPHATVHAAPTTSKPEEIQHSHVQDLDLHEEKPATPEKTFSSRVPDQFPGQDRFNTPFMPKATVHAAPTKSKPTKSQRSQLRNLDLYNEEPPSPRRTLSPRALDKFPGLDRFMTPFMPYASKHASPTASKSATSTPPKIQHSQFQDLDLDLDLDDEEPAVPISTFSSRVPDQFPGQDRFMTPFMPDQPKYSAPLATNAPIDESRPEDVPTSRGMSPASAKPSSILRGTALGALVGGAAAAVLQRSPSPPAAPRTDIMDNRLGKDITDASTSFASSTAPEELDQASVVPVPSPSSKKGKKNKKGSKGKSVDPNDEIAKEIAAEDHAKTSAADVAKTIEQPADVPAEEIKPREEETKELEVQEKTKSEQIPEPTKESKGKAKAKKKKAKKGSVFESVPEPVPVEMPQEVAQPDIPASNDGLDKNISSLLPEDTANLPVPDTSVETEPQLPSSSDNVNEPVVPSSSREAPEVSKLVPHDVTEVSVPST